MSDKNVGRLVDVNGGERGPLRQLYELPVLRPRAKGGHYVLDKFGRIIPESSIFLKHLYETCESPDTYRQYRGQVLFFERCRSLHGGTGILYDDIDEDFLQDLRNQRLQDVQVGTFLPAASLWFRMFSYLESHGWTKGLIGPESSTRKYRITIPVGGKYEHFFLMGSVSETIPELPRHANFDIIDQHIMKLTADEGIKTRWQIILKTLRLIPFRRSEVIRLTVDKIPSRKELKALRARLTRQGKPLGLQIAVKRAKRGGVRKAFFPLSLLDDFRDYIDIIRPHLVRPGVDCDAIFLSKKTGLGLLPQALTNIYKLAANEAARSVPREVGDYDLALIRPHLLRHRAITDYARLYLDEGIKADEVLITLMEVTGIKSVEVTARYVHIAEDELKAASQPYQNVEHKIELRAASRIVEMFRTRRPRKGIKAKGHRRW